MKNFIKKRTCRRIFFRTTGAFSINIVSADSAQHDSENQNQHTDRHVDIFADRIIQIREFAASSLVYLGLHILLSADPEEHDSGKAGAERANVDRQNIHPLGYNALDQKRYDHTDNPDHTAGCYSSEMKFFLYRCNRCFVQVNQRGKAGKKDSDKENDCDQRATRHRLYQIRKENEQKSRSSCI